jgi:hypothetical protein
MRKRHRSKTDGWLLTLSGCAIAVLIVSGSRSISREQDPSNYALVRKEMETSLRVVDARLRALAADLSEPNPAAQADSLGIAAPERLRARYDLIVAALDSLEDAPESEWRGALPGLRAALADIEHRTDIAQLAASDSVAELDATLSLWLSDVQSQLDHAERERQRKGGATHRDAFDESRRAHATLSDRFDRLRPHTAAADIRARRSLAEELAVLRREVRALVRSIGNGPGPAMG